VAAKDGTREKRVNERKGNVGGRDERERERERERNPPSYTFLVSAAAMMEELRPSGRKNPFSASTHLPISLFLAFSLFLSFSLLFLLFPETSSPLCTAAGGAACGAAERRRELQQQAGERPRYISYEFLRADVVPCSRPGIPYYNCHAMPRANPYSRGCLTITRCARDFSDP